MNQINNFEEYGREYQLQLFNEIITDHRFGLAIIDILYPEYFSSDVFNRLSKIVLNYYKKHEVLLNFTGLRTEINLELTEDSTVKQQLLDTLTEVEKCTISNLNVQEKGLRFCRFKKLQGTVNKIKAKVDKNLVEEYDAIEEELKEAFNYREVQDPVGLMDDIENVLDDDARDPIPTGIKGVDEVLHGGLAKGELAMVIAPLGVGKALPDSANVLTPNGWVKMGMLKEGDEVIGRNGEPTKVLGVYPQGVRPIYSIEFNDNTSALCDEEHLWSVNSYNQRNRSSWKIGKRVKLEPDHTFKVVKTKDMIGKLTVGNSKQLKYKVPIVSPVRFTEQSLSLDPYVLGVLLGDGCLTQTTPNFTTKDDDIVSEVSNRYQGDVTVTNNKRIIEVINDGVTKKIKRELNIVRLLGVKPHLSNLGLLNATSTTKFIPEIYLYNSVKVRTALLQGLVDTDGYVNEHRVEISTVSEELSKGIRELVLGLGGRVSIKKKQGSYRKDGVTVLCKEYYRISFSFPDNGVVPALCARKANRFKPRTKYANNKFIKSITYSHDENATCIYVECSEHLFVTQDYVVTHNTTFLTKVANTGYVKAHKNVLQIFFEDKTPSVQRKHYTAMSEVPLNELSSRKEEVIAKLKPITEKIKAHGNHLHLVKMPADGVTVAKIKNEIKRINSKFPKIDLIIIDYLDCISADKVVAGQEDWSNEGRITRQLEVMIEEMQVACWTATQGGRSSTSIEVVKVENMGGNLKKAQIAHFIMSIGKTLEQKEAKVATISILKNRMGDDGMVFGNCKFDNGLMRIDTADVLTERGFEEQNSKSKTEAAQAAIRAYNQTRIDNMNAGHQG